MTAKQTAKATYQYEGNSARIEISRELFNSLTERKLDETIDATKKVIAIAKEKVTIILMKYCWWEAVAACHK